MHFSQQHRCRTWRWCNSRKRSKNDSLWCDWYRECCSSWRWRNDVLGENNCSDCCIMVPSRNVEYNQQIVHDRILCAWLYPVWSRHISNRFRYDRTSELYALSRRNIFQLIGIVRLHKLSVWDLCHQTGSCGFRLLHEMFSWNLFSILSLSLLGLRWRYLH